MPPLFSSARSSPPEHRLTAPARRRHNLTPHTGTISGKWTDPKGNSYSKHRYSLIAVFRRLVSHPAKDTYRLPLLEKADEEVGVEVVYAGRAHYNDLEGKYTFHKSSSRHGTRLRDDYKL